jgi:soluble lytic murein transglycosylase
MHRANWNLLGLIGAVAAAGVLTGGPLLAATQKVPMPRPRPAVIAAKQPAPVAKTNQPAAIAAATTPLPQARPAERTAAPALAAAAPVQANVSLRGSLLSSGGIVAPMLRPTAGPFAVAPATTSSATDIAAVKQVIEATRKGKAAEADSLAKAIADPVARKLADWVILRSDNTQPSFQRYTAFVAANPSWPHAALFRRRAENALWNDRLDDASVRAFFAQHQPSTGKGRYMLARALLAQGDRAGAATLVRRAWREDESSSDVERRVLETFGDMLTRDDHKARMEHRFYAEDVEAGMRAAERLGGNDLVIARARAAVIRKAGNAKALLDAVPAAARGEAGYIFTRVRWLRLNNKPEEAGKLILTAPKDPAASVDLDQWWVERRLLVRRLLDNNDAQTAYRVAREAAPPMKGTYRTDAHFTAGWIALRYLHDAPTAAAHFAQIPIGTVNPHALGRAGYWQGRAAEAMSQRAKAKEFYEMGAKYTATYYGQLARARLGLADLGLRGPPQFTPEERATLNNLEVVRAAKILYALDERDMLASIYAELGESASDVAGMAMLGEVAGQHGDGRAMLMLGKGGYTHGLPLDYYAYPTVGLPDFRPIAPPVDPAVTYSIARQESHFNQKVVSTAHAMGFMQVTPEAARDTAKVFNAVYDRGRLLSDPIYNMQMGTAELAILLKGYNGSYILTFAGYNAGRGRVRQWIAAYGDPRDPKVDPVDWCERIPIAETRNYVQRIMENLQVYRARFGGGSKLVVEADMRRGGAN